MPSRAAPASAAAAAVHRAEPGSSGADSMIKVGIVGAGIRGRLFARALEGHAEVVGLSDSSASARESASRTGLPIYAEQLELMEKGRPDALIVATPDFAHAEPAITAATAGLHLLVEKPLATSLGEAYAIHDAVTTSGVRLMVGFENRWNPHFRSVRQAIDDGSLGRLVWQSANLSNSYHVPTTMLSWAADSSPVWFLMPHTADLVCWLSGATPVSVFARGTRGLLAARGIDTWDVVHASIALDDGSVASLTSAWVLPDSAPGIVDFTYQVVGAGGMVKADLGSQGLAIASDSYRSIWPLGGDIDGDPVGPAVWMARRFVRALSLDEIPGPGVDQGVLITEVLCAIDESLATGRSVDLVDLRARR